MTEAATKSMLTADRDPILVLNSGSSSLKFGLYGSGDEDEELLLEGSAEGVERAEGMLRISSAKGETLLCDDHVLESQQDALQAIASAVAHYAQTACIAVGHRVVHGGPHLREHQLITPKLLAQLEGAVHFAPLHIPQALKLIRQAQKIFPAVPHFVCFDDAFHATMPEVATHLPLPPRYFAQGVMRYGFHGISYESIVHRLGDTLPARAVFAHLGNGASVAAIHDGRSIDTSMGLTPTGGVPMGTRSGDLDPGVLLYLMRTESLNADTLEDLLNRHSGLAGFADGESDMQQILQRAAAKDADAELAVEAFTVAVRKYIGAYAALMGGIDLLVFTGGIGQHSGEIRERICEGLEFLDLGVSSIRVKTMPTEEERQIARHCRRLLS